MSNKRLSCANAKATFPCFDNINIRLLILPKVII